MVAGSPSCVDPELENLTGLLGAASRRGGLPETPRVLAAAPHEIIAQQRDERFDVTSSERLVPGPQRVGRHARIVCRLRGRRVDTISAYP